jgi:hypothetical protein
MTTLKAARVLALLLLLAAPAHASRVSFTVPKWSAADSTGRPLVGAPALVKTISLDFRLDAGRWIPYWGGSITVARAGKMDGRRLSWMSMPDGLYRDSVSWRAATADSAGNASDTANVVRRKR